MSFSALFFSFRAQFHLQNYVMLRVFNQRYDLCLENLTSALENTDCADEAMFTNCIEPATSSQNRSMPHELAQL